MLEDEPPAPDNPLLDMPNVLWTPHTAGYSVDAQADNAAQTTDEVLRVLAGEPPRALVNPEVLARARLKLAGSQPSWHDTSTSPNIPAMSSNVTRARST